MAYLFRSIVLFTLLFSQNSFAIVTPQYSLGIGLLNAHLTRTTDSTDASDSFLGVNHYPIQLQAYWTVFGMLMAPRLATDLLFPRKTADGAADASVLLLSFPRVNIISPSFHWTYGLGILQTTIDGNDGTVTLNNGTSTRTFYRPSESSKAQQFTLELGLNKSLTSTWQLNSEILMTGLFGEKRSYYLMFTFNYHFQSSGFSEGTIE